MKTYISLGLALACSALSTGEVLAWGRGSVRAGGAVATPYGARSGTVSREAAVGPAGGAYQYGSRTGTVVTPGGSTVRYGGAEATRTTPGGLTAGRAVGGVQVTTPGGRTATRVGEAGGVRGPAGAAGAYRGGAVVGPYGGVAAGAGGVAVGPGGVAAKHSTFYTSSSYLNTRGVAVRGGYAYHTAYFTPQWYGVHRAAWVPTRWWGGRGVWFAPAWGVVAGYCGLPAVPITYDYGTTVVYQNDVVYVNGDQLATADAYAIQAATIADLGREAKPPADDEWQPLGVFGLVQGEETIANNLFELAVNKAGTIRGNYYDALADNNLPVYGSVDRTTQRAAWSVGDKKEVVYEAGLYNLTQPQCTVLIHYGKEKTRQMILVRLEQSSTDGTPSP